MQEKIKKSKLKYVAIAVIMYAFISALIKISSGTSNSTTPNDNAVTIASTATPDPVLLTQAAQSKAEAEKKKRQDQWNNAIKGVSYDNLFRNNKQYQDKTLLLQGKIIQVQNEDSDYTYRISITQDQYGYYTNPVLSSFTTKTRYLEDDIVQFIGVSKGIQQYKSILGETISIPSIQILDMKLIQKAGDQ